MLMNIIEATIKATKTEIRKSSEKAVKKLEKRAGDTRHRIGLNHFQDYLYESATRRGEKIGMTYKGDSMLINNLFDGKNKNQRENICRELYRRGLVDFDNEESKLSFCGVYSVCDIWLETVR